MAPLAVSYVAIDLFGRRLQLSRRTLYHPLHMTFGKVTAHSTCPAILPSEIACKVRSCKDSNQLPEPVQVGLSRHS